MPHLGIFMSNNNNGLRCPTFTLQQHNNIRHGTGRAVKIRDLAQMMTKIFDLDLEPFFAEPRREIVRASYILHPTFLGEMVLSRMRRMIEKKGRNLLHCQMIGSVEF